MPRGSNPNSRKALEAHRNVYNSETGSIAGKKGYQKHVENEAKRKTLRQELEALLSTEVSDKNGNKTSVSTAISTALIQKAMKGDTKAYEIIRDTIGQKPVEQIMVADIDLDVIKEVESMVKGK